MAAAADPPGQRRLRDAEPLRRTREVQLLGDRAEVRQLPIGREIARRLVAAGMTVYLGARDPVRGREADAVGARFVQLDVTDEEQATKAVAGIDALDVLVNNAAVAVEWGTRPEDVSAAQMRAAF